MTMKTNKERLFALDLLRGLDMVLLAAVGTLIRAYDSVWGLPDGFMYHITHHYRGFVFWDLIMPLFIFMCGAATPFALGRRMKDGRPTAEFWKHVAWRVGMLWVLGMVCQGHLLTYDPMKISPYNNTLQTIAVGYLVTAAAMCVPSVRFRQLLPVALALGYTALLAVSGDYSEKGNFAMICELKVLSWIVPEGSRAYVLHNHTWFLTSMMYAAMALTGYHATELLRSALTQWQKAKRLAAGGAVLLALGFAAAAVIPVSKPICTLSFTLQAMGWSVLAYAACYVAGDIWKWRRGTWIFILYGQFALWAYMAGVFRPAFTKFSEILFGGLSLWIGREPMPFVHAVFYVAAVTGILVLRRRVCHSGPVDAIIQKCSKHTC